MAVEKKKFSAIESIAVHTTESLVKIASELSILQPILQILAKCALVELKSDCTNQAVEKFVLEEFRVSLHSKLGSFLTLKIYPQSLNEFGQLDSQYG